MAEFASSRLLMKPLFHCLWLIFNFQAFALNNKTITLMYNYHRNIIIQGFKFKKIPCCHLGTFKEKMLTKVKIVATSATKPEFLVTLVTTSVTILRPVIVSKFTRYFIDVHTMKKLTMRPGTHVSSNHKYYQHFESHINMKTHTSCCFLCCHHKIMFISNKI